MTQEDIMDEPNQAVKFYNLYLLHNNTVDLYSALENSIKDNNKEIFNKAIQYADTEMLELLLECAILYNRKEEEDIIKGKL